MITMDLADLRYKAQLALYMARNITGQTGKVLLKQAKLAGGAIADKAKLSIAAARNRVECLKSGHTYHFQQTEEYMGVGGKEPVYWRTCVRCNKNDVGRVVASNTSTKLWQGVYSGDSQQVEETSLPQYTEKTKDRK